MLYRRQKVTARAGMMLNVRLLLMTVNVNATVSRRPLYMTMDVADLIKTSHIYDGLCKRVKGQNPASPRACAITHSLCFSNFANACGTILSFVIPSFCDIFWKISHSFWKTEHILASQNELEAQKKKKNIRNLQEIMFHVGM